MFSHDPNVTLPKSLTTAIYVAKETFNQHGGKSPYQHLSTEAKEELRQFLYLRQYGLCAYCECSLGDSETINRTTKIEHFHPQSSVKLTQDCLTRLDLKREQDTTLLINNLLLVCAGNKTKGSELHCDSSKADIDICSVFLNPNLNRSFDSLVHVNPLNGAICIRPGAHPGELCEANTVLDDILHLNNDQLCEMRRKIAASLRGEIAKLYKREQLKGHYETRTSIRDKFVSNLRGRPIKKDYPSVHFSIADFLEKEAGKNFN